MKHNCLKKEFFLIGPWQKRSALLTYFVSAYSILLRYWWQANPARQAKKTFVYEEETQLKKQWRGGLFGFFFFNLVL